MAATQGLCQLKKLKADHLCVKSADLVLSRRCLKILLPGLCKQLFLVFLGAAILDGPTSVAPAFLVHLLVLEHVVFVDFIGLLRHVLITFLGTQMAFQRQWYLKRKLPRQILHSIQTFILLEIFMRMAK